MNKLILAAAALPPPMHGQAYITVKLIEALTKESSTLHVCDLSPESLIKSLGYHVIKCRKVIKTSIYIIFYSMLYRHKTFYTIVESGYGIYYNYYLCSLARLFHYDIYLHHHTSKHAKVFSKTFDWLTKITPNAHHIVLADGMREDLKSKYSNISSIAVSSNACHVKVPNIKPIIIDEKINLGMLSNLTEEKGAIRALDLAIELKKSGLEITLTLAGPIIEPKVEKSIIDAKTTLGEDLIILGPVHGAAKEDFYKKTDVFLFPSTYPNEAQPVVIYEALSYGCAIITSCAGYITDMLKTESAHVYQYKNTILESKDFVYSCIKKSKDNSPFIKKHKLSALEFNSLIKDICS
ncbi:MAG: glycosyltransferase family 4 protein [Blastochloris viridis]|uniref:Glycosyltransferase family 4 protein n=1 Tax=Blastochloris viridis TaxID=1079 RepID=A0A6N4RAS2_BLAVI|nr:MAG: glycosyltransferase family 4 protein [Blastochloris viridis]